MTFLRRLKNETGQAIVLTTIAMVVIMAMSAFVIDLGIDFRTKRKLQATADAATLAGAQELPGNPTAARVLAQSYADKNGGNVESISVQSKFNPNDTIEVKTKKNEPSVFGRAIGIGSTDIHASAKARVDLPYSALHVAPMVVHCNHEFLHNCGGADPPGFPSPRTTLDYDPMGAPGAFGMLNLSDKGGTPGTSEQAEWIRHGWDKQMDVNRNYNSNPGAKFSSSEIQGALEDRMNSDDPVLLFPVFEHLSGTGSNAKYWIIGWVGFHLESFTVHGNNATLRGYFVSYIAQGILASSGSGSTNFGVKSIQLIE